MMAAIWNDAVTAHFVASCCSENCRGRRGSRCFLAPCSDAEVVRTQDQTVELDEEEVQQRNQNRGGVVNVHSVSVAVIVVATDVAIAAVKVRTLCVCPIAGVRTQEKTYAVPLEAIRMLATDQHVLTQCFNASDQLRSMLLRVVYQVLTLKETNYHVQTAGTKPSSSAPPSRTNRLVSTQRAITTHLETEWKDVASALRQAAARHLHYPATTSCCVCSFPMLLPHRLSSKPLHPMRGNRCLQVPVTGPGRQVPSSRSVLPPKSSEAWAQTPCEQCGLVSRGPS